MKAWTEYPLENKEYEGLGLVWREIEVLSWDRDKYLIVIFEGHRSMIKAGYVFREGELKENLTRQELDSLPETNYMEEWGEDDE